MVAKVMASPLAAEKVIVTDCPGKITGGVPVPWKVPDSTSGFELSTFSMVMVAFWLTGGLSSSFLQEEIARGTRGQANN
jgi:hypothetical protein